jgi:hypothetical protein
MSLLRISCVITFGLMIAVPLTVMPAFGQSGVIAFQDHCTALLYAMRGDGSGRVALLPPLPLPTDKYVQPRVLDVTTGGPTTVVYYAGMTGATFDHGLFAVQVDDSGVLRPELPVRLSLPKIAGADPDSARSGSFSPFGFGDRFAFVAPGQNASVLMTAKVDRDSNLKITGLSDFVVVGDLYTIGIPDPKFPDQKGFTGFIDYSPDGRSIVASIYYDLWMIYLHADNTFDRAERLTGTSGFAEWNPAFSLDGSHIAYTGGAISGSGGVSLRDTDIYSLVPATRTVTRVTANSNRGSAAMGRDHPTWSPDDAWIGFAAYVNSHPPRNSICSGIVNSEIFLIKADGSTTATPITNTNGTSVEDGPRWGR